MVGFQFLPIFFQSRECAINIWNVNLLHTSKNKAPRVKSQARGQNNRSRAFKWGIVHLCSSITLREATSFIEIWVFQILHFCKNIAQISLPLLVENQRVKDARFALECDWNSDRMLENSKQGI